MSVGKFCAALGAVQNENTLALINLNFDFALCKFDAPKEFLGLGASLSNQRREAAESGTAHRIARKLGALFEQVVPTTPELISAYGSRVSEISAMKATNPRGHSKHGPFADQMGIDGTAIWAAATSGPSAIPVLMLACMLARIWDGPEATSLWMEIIEQRQKEIRRTCDGTKSSDYATLQAMQQEFPRAQLADWDASIRAWLRAADEAKMFNQRQLLLIVNNINLPVSNNMSVYRSVLESWELAMVSMNNIIKGVSQRVQDGALLLGLSAWHLYPDMVVYGAETKEIRYKDPLIEAGGILTIGLQNADGQDEGIYWSLPLAHLRYYGDPVQIVRTISQDTSRVSIEQLALVTLGAVLSEWGEPTSEALNLATWFSECFEFLDRIAGGTDQLMKERLGARRIPYSLRDEREVARAMIRNPGWLELLMTASKALLVSSEAERETSLRLVTFGMRRCGNFLAQNGHPLPFFGLSDPKVLLPMLISDEERVRVLRIVAQKLDVDKRTLIIRYKRTDPDTDNSWYEYASASPYMVSSRKRDVSGAKVQSFHHKRWIAVRRGDESLKYRPFNELYYACSCKGSCVSSPKTAGGCSCLSHHGGCCEACSCHIPIETQEQTLKPLSKKGKRKKRGHETPKDSKEAQQPQPKCYTELVLLRNEEAKKRAEAYHTLNEICSVQELSEFVSDGLPKFRELQRLEPHLLSYPIYDSLKDTWEKEHDLEYIVITLKGLPWNEDKDEDMRGGETDRPTVEMLKFLFGDKNAAIFQSQHPKCEQIHATNALSLQDFLEIFRSNAIDVFWFNDHLYRMGERQNFADYTKSLRALASATNIYKLLPNATVDLRITNSPLHSSAWARSMTNLEIEHHLPSRMEPYLGKLTRSMAFACISYFDSGSFDIDPHLLEKVMAMSTGNSIFVSAPLLCDPYEKPLEHEIQRVVGNIGRAGIAFLIPPQETKTRKMDLGTWNQVNHALYDGKLEDSFKNTSLHLSFTPYTQPINMSDHGLQDIAAFFIESVVSVHDRDKWVGDIDVLKTLESRLFFKHWSMTCSHTVDMNSYSKLVSLDNWEELYDKENISGVVRAHGNWLARRAASAISIRQGFYTVVLTDPVCWECIRLEGWIDKPRGTTFIY